MKHIVLLSSIALLAACTETPQTIGDNQKAGKTAYQPAYQGTGMPYQVPGWKAGDKGSWESQMKARTQMGQNDYNKVP